jgi:hypothetical protein
MTRHSFRLLAIAVFTAAAVATVTAGAASSAREAARKTNIKPADFGRKIDNPWYPLRPGTTYVYRGGTAEKPTRDVIAVTRQKKKIMGVRCVVVHDNFYVAGRQTERTSDWFTQDKRGRVWYFGEDSAQLDGEGNVTSTAGSWQAGVDGALPGIIMPARPRVNQTFRQEYYKGHAEDHFTVLSLSVRVDVPYVSSKRALLTREFSPLEPGVIEHKYYVRGIGLVEEATADKQPEQVLVSVTRT